MNLTNTLKNLNKKLDNIIEEINLTKKQLDNTIFEIETINKIYKHLDVHGCLSQEEYDYLEGIIFDKNKPLAARNLAKQAVKRLYGDALAEGTPIPEFARQSLVAAEDVYPLSPVPIRQLPQESDIEKAIFIWKRLSNSPVKEISEDRSSVLGIFPYTVSAKT